MKYFLILLFGLSFISCQQKSSEEDTKAPSQKSLIEEDNIQLLFFRYPESHPESDRLEAMFVDLANHLDLAYEVVYLDQMEMNFITKIFTPQKDDMIFYKPETNVVIDLTEDAKLHINEPARFIEKAEIKHSKLAL